MDNIIEAKNIRFSYDDEEPKKYVVDGVTLSVVRGEMLAILGHNGSGKSTIAKHFNSVLLPNEGTVVVDGMDTANEELLSLIHI